MHGETLKFEDTLQFAQVCISVFLKALAQTAIISYFVLNGMVLKHRRKLMCVLYEVLI